MRGWARALVGVLVSLGSAWAQEEFESTPFTSALVCGECHKEIHGVWLKNLHSRAATEPVFAQALAEAESTLKERARPFCLTCHAPTTVLTRDYALRRNISRESVTCDFCHSMVEANPGESVPFELEVGNVKRGPYKDADSKDHGVAFSELHLSARLCASCHEYRTPGGVSVLSTYSEYLEGPYPARSVVCQSCHMPVIMANVVDPKVKRDPRSFINSHRMPGGHSIDQLRRAIELEWSEVERLPERIQARVALFNLAAGHRVPTGMPTRKLVLEVEARSASGRFYKERMVYQKVVADAAGSEILKDGEMFTRAASIRRDNRIRPGERRVEGFSFPIPRGEEAHLVARLVFEFAPLGTAEQASRIDFATIEQTSR